MDTPENTLHNPITQNLEELQAQEQKDSMPHPESLNLVVEEKTQADRIREGIDKAAEEYNKTHHPANPQ